ncbi:MULTISPECIES: SGNH/GDSL hydrolase family protein [Spirosoma]|nr:MULTISPECIES: SGNH/GDSL hydrolase family protein [Spirosoma]
MSLVTTTYRCRLLRISSMRYVVGVLMLVGMARCTADYPATNTAVPPQSTGPVSTTPAPATTTPGSTPPTSPATSVDTLTALPPPRFEPDGGNLYAGTPVRLVADSLPPQAVVEYSVDQGVSWTVGDRFPLMDGGVLLARVRVGTKAAQRRSRPFSVYFNRVLIIGNSIMEHLPVPSLGWFNSNGMAASSPQHDFVYLLTQQLKALQPAVVVRLQNGGSFERNYAQMNLADWDESLRFAPDLVVVRIAENVAEDQVDRLRFETYYRNLLTRFAASAGPVKIVCSTSFWNQPRTDAIIRSVAAEKGYPVADLSALVDKPEYMASQYKNPDVARHPNDRGMQQIASLLWASIQ